MSSPQIFVDGVKHQITGMGNVIVKDDLHKPPKISIDDLDHVIRGKDFKNLRDLLVQCSIQHMNNIERFWPDQLLKKIMTKDRVLEELTRMKERRKTGHIFASRTIDEYANLIRPSDMLDADASNGAHNAVESDITHTGGHHPKRYLKIFAILLLCQKKGAIRDFIEAGTCDTDLPLRDLKVDGKFRLARHTEPFTRVSGFEMDWNSATTELFYTHQFRFLVPYLCLPSDPSDPCKHVKFCRRTILPLVEEDTSKLGEGGYGVVQCIRIHPICHGFHSLQQVQSSRGLFAVKTMLSKKPEHFNNERSMLKLLGGKHEHIITLLMTYEVNDTQYLLFPWANSDLTSYWSRNSPPYSPITGQMDKRLMLWISTQILGLASALDSIHNPTHLPMKMEKRWARHGDLKPDNVLWFPDNGEIEGVLVIGDLGITSIHGIKSRSNVPNEVVPVTPDYRPPECDQAGGTISRAFDIWTLGCLLLDMVCWILGGVDRVKEFEQERLMVPYLGVGKNIFFDVKKTLEGNSAILVKEAVIKCIQLLHEHPGCTHYLHDLLDMIAQRMIVVLSKQSDRIRSEELVKFLRQMNSEVGQYEYGLKPNPRDPKGRKNEVSTAVKAALNENARERFDKFKGHLGIHEGLLLPSKTVGEMLNTH